MRIGIDARMMGPQNTRGIGRYTEEMVRALIEVAPENEYVLVTRTMDHVFSADPGVKTVVADIPWYGWKEQLALPSIFKAQNASIWHIPHWNVPLFYRGPFVITIHDLLLRHHPSSAKMSTRHPLIRFIKRVGYRLVLWNAIRKAKCICVPTEWVKEDVLQFYPKAEKKIIVTGEGVSIPRAEKTSEEAKGPKYLLYVGSAYPHKRLDLLLEAWNRISGKYPGLWLTIVGERDAFIKRMELRARQSGFPRMIWTGSVSDQDLVRIYQDALVFIFPSSFEGFGLPPVEALAVGTPVISSDAKPMPEVLGKKGVIYFKNGILDDMIQAIEAVVDNPTSFQHQAQEVQEEIRIRHDWKKMAKRVLEAYRE